MNPPIIKLNTELPSGERTTDVHRVVVHSMAEFVGMEDGKYEYAPYALAKLGVSVHAFVTPAGQIIEAVPYDRLAYGALGHNQGSFHVEFLVQGEWDYESFVKRINDFPAYKQKAFEAGVEYIGKLMVVKRKKLDITSHMLLDPERKFDPGTMFPFAEFKRRVESYYASYTPGEG